MVLQKACTAEKALDHWPENLDSYQFWPRLGIAKLLFLWWPQFSQLIKWRDGPLTSLVLCDANSLRSSHFSGYKVRWDTGKNLPVKRGSTQQTRKWAFGSPRDLESIALAAMKGGAALESSSWSLPAVIPEKMGAPTASSLHPSQSSNKYIIRYIRSSPSFKRENGRSEIMEDHNYQGSLWREMLNLSEFPYCNSL